jgi:hypothetical protein
MYLPTRTFLQIVNILKFLWWGGPWFEPQWEARFSMLTLTGPEANPATCTMGN